MRVLETVLRIRASSPGEHRRPRVSVSPAWTRCSRTSTCRARRCWCWSCAFAGRERILARLPRTAIAGGYRFYSYGDAMLDAVTLRGLLSHATTGRAARASRPRRTASSTRRRSCRWARRRPSRRSPPDELRALGAADHARQHLPPRPAPRRRAGRASSAGCTRFSGWDGPILTDSGGFQVFSLGARCARRRRRRDVPHPTSTVAAALHARGRGRDPGSARRRHRHGARRVPAVAGDAARRSSRRCARTTRWARAPRAAAPRADGQRALRHRAGRRRSRPAARARRRSSRRSTSTATPSAAWRSASRRPMLRAGRRGRRRACPRTSRATSWASAPRGHPRGGRRAASTCSTACCRRATPARRPVHPPGLLKIQNARYTDDTAARSRVRLPGLRAHLARLPPPPDAGRRAHRAGAGDPALTSAFTLTSWRISGRLSNSER